jgi:hypothetical protein
MAKIPVSVLCSLVVLPLIGCAGDFSGPRQAAAVAPTAVAATSTDTAPAPYVYPAGQRAPAAILVFLPGDDGGLARDPALWAAQDFDVVMPRPADLYRLVADQQAEMARLIASAHALGDAPLWLVGPGSLIEAALAAPQLRGGAVSGVVMTSVTSNTGTCSESFFYSDLGNGAPPKYQVRRSGDCGPNQPGTTGGQPSWVPAPPSSRPNSPRIIEASSAGKHPAPAAQVRHLAQLIKETPSS